MPMKQYADLVQVQLNPILFTFLRGVFVSESLLLEAWYYPGGWSGEHLAYQLAWPQLASPA